MTQFGNTQIQIHVIQVHATKTHCVHQLKGLLYVLATVDLSVMDSRVVSIQSVRYIILITISIHRLNPRHSPIPYKKGSLVCS